MPPVSNLIHAAGWRQGSIASQADNAALLRASIDRIPAQGEALSRLVVITQDCDLVGQAAVEPFVELILCKETTKAKPLYLNGRNPRLLHLQANGPQKASLWLEFSIHDRFRVRKEDMANFTPDKRTRLEAQDVRLLKGWIARRYTRPAFPDAFNRRLASIDRRLETLFKSQDGRIVTGIFVEVPDEEYAVGRAYDIAVRLTARAQAWDDHELRRTLERFEERLSSILDDCDGISLSDVRTLPEEDLTLAHLRRLKRLDKDYRSLPEEEGLERPAGQDDEL